MTLTKRLAVWLLLTSAAAAAPAAPLAAQLGVANAQGVSIGHVHLLVRDPEAQKKLWVLLGAEVTRSGSLELLKFPGVFIILTPGAPAGGSEGSTVNHFGFVVPNVDQIRAKLTAAGLPTVQELTNPKRWVTMFPDEVKVEFVEDQTAKLPVAAHHLHLSTSDMEPLRAWYVKTFGGLAETRRGFPSAVFDAGEVDMIQAPQPQAPTKGRAVDHIGFEVKGLEAFCRKLEAQGVTFETPYREMPQLGGLKLAFITDPVGTRIELTEGLAAR
jgi:catechol 2,3-dioxygenase-like lactoylglutathione lyase family enzyme